MSFLKDCAVFNIIKDDVEEMGGKIIFTKGAYCGGKNKCSGIFYTDSKDNPVIKVAQGKLKEHEWFGVLLHEYSHFLQWRDYNKYWEDFCNYDVNLVDILKTPKKYKKALISLMELELDCEKKAYNIIKNNKLLDHKEYATAANSILYKYAFLYKYGKWPDDNKKYQKIQYTCPNKLLKSYKEYLKIPKEVVEYYK